ncbi:peptidylprolyl isomerase [Cohnella yongneupensis]|uniref:Peptidylprolyl isomerase n=1 Tax=Cohnella yongneupensis TaxID=425006 RepID=A0ABW0R5U0_9BACL
MSDMEKEQANVPENDNRDTAETLRLNDSEGSEATEQEEIKLAQEEEGAAGASAPKAAMPAWPWIGLSVIAVAALAFVLIANPLGGSDKKIAKFDGGSVSKVDFYEEIKTQVPAEQFATMVDAVIEKKLISKMADKAGIEVTDADVNKEIAKYETNFGGAEGFQKALDQNGIDLATFKEQQIIPQVLKQRVYANANPATEDDFKAYYEANKDKFATTPKQVKASHILVATQEEADAILKDLKAGKDFATIAKAKSIDTGSAVNGGDLGDFFGPDAQMVPEFLQAALALDKGQLSDVVQSQYGFHIIKVTDVKPAVVPSYDEKKADVQDAYWAEQLGTNEASWLDKLKADNHVKNLVKEDAPAETPAASSPAASAPASSPAASPSASAAQ